MLSAISQKEPSHLRSNVSYFINHHFCEPSVSCIWWIESVEQLICYNASALMGPAVKLNVSNQCL